VDHKSILETEKMSVQERPTYATERLSALSDGVFSIVLTLLVLDLKIPELPSGFGDERLAADLEGQIPNFLAWVISFILVARFWIVHHAVVASLARCHTGTMVWNFVVLGLVSLVPFAAGLIGTYEYDPLAVSIFAIMLGATGVAMGLLARHAATETQLHKSEQVSDIQWHWKYHARVLPLFAAASILLLAVEELASLAIWAIEPLAAWFGATRRR
jgi:uncharacterized membrane protein